eukprot:6192185-Pleurochrysis_carterae.AAC.1
MHVPSRRNGPTRHTQRPNLTVAREAFSCILRLLTPTLCPHPKAPAPLHWSHKLAHPSATCHASAVCRAYYCERHAHPAAKPTRGALC